MKHRLVGVFTSNMFYFIYRFMLKCRAVISGQHIQGIYVYCIVFFHICSSFISNMLIFVHPILYFDMGCHWFVGYFTRGLAKPWGAGPTVLGEVGRRENLQQRNSGSWAKCSLLDAHQNRLAYDMYMYKFFIIINIIIYICFMNLFV